MTAGAPMKPASTTHTALRFCGSCCLTVTCWALWLGLSTTLACLLYVAISHELPVPGFVLRRIENHFTKANLGVEFGRAQIDPSGKLLLHDVRVRVRPYPEAVFTSRLAFIKLNFWSVIGLPEAPTEIQIEGATLQLPAMLSPSGTSEPLARDLALVLHHEDKSWRVSQFTGRFGRLTVTAHGDYLPPPRPAGTPPLDLAKLVPQLLAQGRTLALALQRLEAFDAPTLSLQLTTTPGLGNFARLQFAARAINQPWGHPVQLESVTATTAARLDGPGARPVRVHIAAAHGTYRNLGSAEAIRAVLTAQLPSAGAPVQLTEALVALGRLTAEGETVLGPLLRADLTGWPATVRGHTSLQMAGEFLTAAVEADLPERSATLTASGRGDPTFINRVLGRHTPRAAPFFVFGDPVVFTARATLGPGWKFQSLASRVAAGRIDSRGVKLTSARGRVDINGMDFLAHDARVTLADAEARGSYWMNFSTIDYRMLLTGRLRPPEISGWFTGRWWTEFWAEHFAFPVSPPSADVEVRGCWRDPGQTLFFGRAEAVEARVWGGDFERVQARVFLRPHFTHVIDSLGLQAGGQRRLTGSLKRFTDSTTRETNRLEFDGVGNLDPQTYRRMLSGKGDAVIDSLQFTEPPSVQVNGSLNGKWPELVPTFTFTGEAKAPLHYSGFPLDHASVRGRLDADTLQLEELKFGLGGGQGGGNLSYGLKPGPDRLGFNLTLDQADLVRAIRSLETYQTNRTGVAGTSATESKFIKQAAAGRLQLSLSARGAPEDLLHLTGNGNAALTGADLGEIQLFGVLSQVLSGLSLNFSSLKLDAARTSFRLDGGHLWLPDLKITGPSAVIEAKGDFALDSNMLDFTARLKPYEENRNLLTAAIGLVINPLTSILELKLTGPISKPSWSIVVGPSSHQPAPGSATQPAAAPPAEK